MTLLLAILACDPGKPIVPDTGMDTAEDTTVDTADTGAEPLACPPAHARVAHTPAVLSATRVAEWSYLSWQLDLWLQLNGLGWLTPTRHDVTTWRVRYSTQDRGQVVEASALVVVPNVAQGTSLGTVLWTHPTSGFTDACAPSVNAVEGLAPPIVQAARGYVTVAPDYLGLLAGGDAPELHPWIVGEPTAIASLDALRAVDAWLPTSGAGARVDRSRIVYWGWSEGGYAALMADRWAPTWAPEFAPVGVVAAVPPTDLVAHLREGVETWSPAARSGALILAAHADWHGGDLAEVLLPSVAAALPAERASSCATWPSVDDAGSVEAVYQPALLSALRDDADLEPWTCWLRDSSLPTPSVPYTGTAPVLLVTAAGDTLVPEQGALEAIPRMCDEGYTLEHVSCAGAEHGDAPVLTLPRQIAWMDARLRGEPVPAGCAPGAPVACE